MKSHLGVTETGNAELVNADIARAAIDAYIGIVML